MIDPVTFHATHVRLIGPRYTDDVVSRLAWLPHLESIRLYSTGVTDAGVARLQVALPHCEIER
jgi:hypothetical protein